MSLTKPDGLKKNKVLDFVSLAFVAGVLGLTPLIVGWTHTSPAKGPDPNPTILIAFLIFLTVIVLLSLGAVGGMVMGKMRPKDQLESLTPLGLNLLNVLSKAVAGLFLISGFVKLQDPIGFGYKLDDYWYFFHGLASFFPADTMKTFSVPIAAFVSVFEVALGFALITGYKMRATAWMLLLIMMFFTLLTGLAAFTGKLQDCGCFGDALKLEPMQTFGKDLLLMIPGIVIWLHRKRIHPYYRRPMPAFASIGSFILGAALSIYCYWHLELLDFRGAYKVGQDLAYNSMNAGEDGEIYAHDFTFPPASSPVFCDEDFTKGPWLMIIMYDIEDHPREPFDAAAGLVAELKAKAPGIKVVGGTNSGPSARKKLGMKFAEDFCWNDFDQKVIRTIIRSTPGFVLVQDGIVMKKWHHNDMPSVEQLQKLVGPAANIAPPAPESPDSSQVVQDSLNQE
ncbi:MAG: DoxX family protein [Bacteroidetes bacterium]|nr:DoxX family protein [Bacteroidota bacterium]MBP6640930.1 DoxX family protein [Bacteroidia bacterium]